MATPTYLVKWPHPLIFIGWEETQIRAKLHVSKTTGAREGQSQDSSRQEVMSSSISNRKDHKYILFHFFTSSLLDVGCARQGVFGGIRTRVVKPHRITSQRMIPLHHTGRWNNHNFSLFCLRQPLPPPVFSMVILVDY